MEHEMGLDCYVCQSKLDAKELEDFKEEALEEHASWDSSLVVEDLWYGRKTHRIMDYLLQGYEGEDNCQHIPIDDVTVEDLTRLFREETIIPDWFGEDPHYELSCLKELIKALETGRDKNQYLYFYAWY